MSDEMKREFDGLRAELRNGMSELGQGLTDVRQGLVEVRQGMNQSHDDMRELRSMFRRTMVSVARLTGDVADLRHDMASTLATKDDVSMLKGCLDNFAGEVAVSRRERTLQDKSFNFLNGHLSDHEARLVRLERQEKKS